MDWGAVGSIAALALTVITIGGGLIAYGGQSQKVRELSDRLDAQDDRINKLIDAVGAAQSIAGEVKLLRQSTEGLNQLAAQKQESAHALLSERMEGLRGEVRSFMQGMAAAAKPPPRAKPSHS